MRIKIFDSVAREIITICCAAAAAIILQAAASGWARGTALHPDSMATARPQGRTAATATRVVHRLLQNPNRLQLVGSSKSRQTFFFRVRIQLASPHYIATVLAASRDGRVAVVTYNAAGLPYAYYGGGIFVMADALHPGELDVLLGASPRLVFGSVKASGPGVSRYNSLHLTAVSGNAGAVALDFSKPLQDTAELAQRASYSASDRILTFTHKGTSTVILAPRGAEFPIRSWAMPETKGMSALYYDITRGTSPLENLFGVTLVKLRASGVPLTVWHYRPGMALRWFPPLNFGSRPGDIQAAEALDRLMPISHQRLLQRQRRLMLRTLDRIIPTAPSGTVALMHIFVLLEIGEALSIDDQATQFNATHPGAPLNFHWNFDRRTYHNFLARTLGKRVMRRLMRTLESLSLGTKSTGTQRAVAVDLLSDIGPDHTDLRWAKETGPLARSLSQAGANRKINAVLVDLLRVRWDMPLGPHQVPILREALANSNLSMFYRIRALEILCFVHNLPYDPKAVVPVIQASLDDAAAYGVCPGSKRYLFDLSLCRNGRKILLEQWLDPQSPLASDSQLGAATFNRLWPGSPGNKLAIAAALRVFNNPKYSDAMRRQAISALCHAPQLIFLKVVAELLKSRSGGLGMALAAVGARKETGALLPAMAEAFPHLTNRQVILLMNSVGFGFVKGSDARSALPLIRKALLDKRRVAVQMGLNAIGGLNFTHAHLGTPRLYRVLLRMVQAGAKYPLRLRVQAVYCLGLATHGQWSPPAAGILPPSEGGPDLTVAGKLWWRAHYAAVRRSALRWAAAHPDYPPAAAKK